MKFATFAHGGQDRIGLVDEAAGRVRPLSAAADMLDHRIGKGNIERTRCELQIPTVSFRHDKTAVFTILDV